MVQASQARSPSPPSQAGFSAPRSVSFPPERESYIAAAWRRCLDDFRLDPDRPPPPEHIGAAALRRRREANHLLQRVAAGEMHRLLIQINEQFAAAGHQPAPFVLMLVDSDAAILEIVTNAAHAALAAGAQMSPGFVWSERRGGVNGPGTCLHDRRPRVVHREDHFFARHRGLTCSAAPLWGPNRQLAGALDVSFFGCGDSRASQMPAAALVNMSARIIEQMLFLQTHQDRLILRFHERPECVGLPFDALAAIDPDGTICAVNSAMPEKLGLPSHTAITGRPASEMFDITVDEMFARAASRPFIVSPLAHGGACPGFASLWPPQCPLPTRPPLRPAPPAQPECAALAAFAGEDAVMRDNAWRAAQVMNKDIHILLRGETGTGKDSFARAIHAAGDRAKKPFIVLSCAAIPETLIESELFGYEPGAFTGARAAGMRGKALAAHQGTLFLDEIGDMPVALQARLLRLLEEKEVVPLGATKAIPVDVRIIAATHEDLEEAVAAKKFRMDLYYRLTGVTLTLPPLRARGDRVALIRRMVAQESQNQAELSPTAAAALAAHDWPGNLRELRSTLRTALAFAASGVIEPHHLPRLPPAASPRPNAPPAPPPPADERAELVAALQRQHWRVSRTAAALGVSRTTLYRKLHRHGLVSGDAG